MRICADIRLSLKLSNYCQHKSPLYSFCIMLKGLFEVDQNCKISDHRNDAQLAQYIKEKAISHFKKSSFNAQESNVKFFFTNIL